MHKLSVAVIGLGKMGLLHAGILGSMENVKLVALCDQKKLLTTFAKKIFKENAAVVNDVSAIADLGIDAVYITTPIPSHYTLIDSIYKDKIAHHVFSEKTLAWQLADSEKICKEANSAGGVNMVGYQKRFAVTFRKAYSLLNDGVIGDVQRFKAYSYSSDFTDVDATDAAKIFASRGGVLKDLGSHAISLALWYFGVLDVNKDPAVTSKNEETVGFNVKACNVDGYIEASWCREGYRMPETGLKIEGSKGVLSVNDDKVELSIKGVQQKVWFRQDLDDKVDFVIWAPEYYREDQHFVNCAITGAAANPDFSDALLVDRIINEVTHKI